ncbi:hypothetical protein RchiOBHm_Chr5g0069191 [Rosa chinensis]|uniref:Uncharacterized protein n=1 Tax=Rosa chinensis TaxID=74649 RepID=A0A2P6QJV8_ROSCH|nr:hypothetical protein RchiOBHm_Chr5g0069191 [Rosa chinensis]
MQGNICKHVIKVNIICESHQGYQPSMSFQSFKELLVSLSKKPMEDSISQDLSMAWTMQMLEQIRDLVEVTRADDIGTVVNNLPLQWASRKGRTGVGKPSTALTTFPSSKRSASRQKTRKRRRLSTLT